MSTLHLAALILAGEFALLAWIILFFMLRRQRHQEHDDVVHADAVMEHLEANEVSHRDALTNLFESTYRLEGEELAAKVDEYLERERAFYNMMLNLYLNRDGAKLKEIPAELAKVIKPWAEITPVGMINASEVKSLESEKARLSVELENTKKTLEQLMEEYMAAFKKAEQQAADSTPEPERAPQTTPPAQDETTSEDIDFDAPDMDAADFDIQPAAASEPEESPKPQPPDEIEPEESLDDALDPSEIDAMLEALAKEAVGEQESAPAKPDEVSERPLSPEEIEEARARDELEGLADLFDLPSEDGEPARKP
ncbi:hypothetical protein [Allochromatium tepidum]|uniref:MJ0042 family finger-like protein n=1 Tax=Allochromatium tepidum TaxID=553982 RepID=A0ABM7QJB2_9GAMM|nr:hypothetical protein [Allochromatium tepidum]BCU05850.1 hypothetical protein Atep_05270 [Allochromatium tepidum]